MNNQTAPVSTNPEIARDNHSCPDKEKPLRICWASAYGLVNFSNEEVQLAHATFNALSIDQEQVQKLYRDLVNCMNLYLLGQCSDDEIWTKIRAIATMCNEDIVKRYGNENTTYWYIPFETSDFSVLPELKFVHKRDAIQWCKLSFRKS